MLNTLLNVAVVFFAIGTLVAVGTAPATITGSGIGLNATVDPPFAVTSVADGPSFRVSSDGEVGGTVSDNGRPLKIERSKLTVNVHVAKSDRDTRVLLVVGLLAMIGLAWTGLLALRKVVRVARDGDPFDKRNVGRLRLLGGVLIAAPVVVWLLNRMLEGTFEPRAVHPSVARVDALPIVVIALSVFALAEVFRAGAELRELESATI